MEMNYERGMIVVYAEGKEVFASKSRVAVVNFLLPPRSPRPPS